MNNNQQPRPTLPSTTILCPRCGYDLRGITQTWNEKGACPLTGKCSECGLDFDWQKAFRESEHPWLFEYHWRRKPIKSLYRTVVASCNPFRFWKETDLYNEIKLAPLIILVVFPIIVIFVSRFITNFWYIWSGWTSNATPVWNRFWWLPSKQSSELSLSHMFEVARYSARYSLADGPFLIMVQLPTIAAVLYWPLVFVFTPTTLMQSRVRPSHILRIALYSVVAPIYFFAIWSIPSMLIAPFDSGPFSLFPEPDWWQRVNGSSDLLQTLFNWLPIGIIFAIVSLAWAFTWWAIACTQYLQLKRAPKVITTLGIIVALLVILHLILPIAVS